MNFNVRQDTMRNTIFKVNLKNKNTFGLPFTSWIDDGN